jgi:hypothetical protein
VYKADTSGRIMLLLSLWVLLLVAAVINGYIRETYVAPRFGSGVAQVYGVAVLSAVVWLAAAYFARGTRGPGWQRWAGIAAVLWVGLTVIFEFWFGHYVAGRPWHELLSAYYLWEGQLWPLVLLSEAVAPLLVGIRENRTV